MSTVSDLRYAVRMMRGSPGATAAAILSLALGIGANATIYGWISGILLNPFPGTSEPATLRVLTGVNRNGGFTSLSYPTYRDLRSDVAGMDGVVVQSQAAVHVELPEAAGGRRGGGDSSGDSNRGGEAASGLLASETQTQGGRQAQRIYTGLVSGNYFDVLGVRPVLGRGFAADEDVEPGRSAVVVIGHRFWQTRAGGRADIVGQTMRINQRPFTIVGVAPDGFAGTFRGVAVDLFVPMMMQPVVAPGQDRLTARGHRWLQAIARLSPGVTAAQAQTALDARASQLARDYPADFSGRLLLLSPFDSPWGLGYVLKPALIVLMAVTGCVLLITCANVANLLLARAMGRRREVAVRLSLGATRGRIMRQLLTESLLLAALGGIGGLAVGAWTSRLLLAFIPPLDIPLQIDVDMDARVVMFTALVSLVTGLVFGIAPALRSSNPRLIGALRDESSTLAGGRRHRLRSLLVVSQVSLSLILLVIALLFLRSLQQSTSMNPGFRASHLLFANFDLFPSGYTPQQGRQIYARLIERLDATPGVEAASLARRRPLSFYGSSSTELSIEDYAPRPDEPVVVRTNVVSPDYFGVMSIPVLRGREFAWTDREGAPSVAIVNEAMARRYWGDRDPVGRRMRLGRGDGAWVTVVGVTATSKYDRLNEAPLPFLFLPVQQSYAPDMVLHVRTTGDPAAMAATVRNIVADVAPGVPLFEVQTIAEHLEFSRTFERFAATLLGAFGILALLLAAVGLYGVMSYIVSQRTRESGIRLALGATPASVRRDIVRHALTLAGTGLTIGLAIAWLASGLLAPQLTGIAAHDPLTFTAVPALLAAVAFAASVFPAIRASRVDPAVALRGPS